MNYTLKAVLILSIIVIFSVNCLAVKDLMALQGNVYDSQGKAVATGDVNVKIYDSLSGGNLIYDSETDFNEAIVNGKYDILLGSKTKELSLEFSKIYYLELNLAGKQITFDGANRQMFQSAVGKITLINGSDTSTLYPLQIIPNDYGYGILVSDNETSLPRTRVTKDGFQLYGPVSTGSRVSNYIEFNNVNPQDEITDRWLIGINPVNIYSNYPKNRFYINEQVGDTTIDRFVIQNTTGNVGIGVTDPSQKLNVAGDVNITSSPEDEYKSGKLYMSSSNGFVASWIENGLFTIASEHSRAPFFTANVKNGNVGIGTVHSPKATLHVGGSFIVAHADQISPDFIVDSNGVTTNGTIRINSSDITPHVVFKSSDKSWSVGTNNDVFTISTYGLPMPYADATPDKYPIFSVDRTGNAVLKPYYDATTGGLSASLSIMSTGRGSSTMTISPTSISKDNFESGALYIDNERIYLKDPRQVPDGKKGIELVNDERKIILGEDTSIYRSQLNTIKTENKFCIGETCIDEKNYILDSVKYIDPSVAYGMISVALNNNYYQGKKLADVIDPENPNSLNYNWNKTDPVFTAFYVYNPAGQYITCVNTNLEQTSCQTVIGPEHKFGFIKMTSRQYTPYNLPIVGVGAEIIPLSIPGMMKLGDGFNSYVNGNIQITGKMAVDSSNGGKLILPQDDNECAGACTKGEIRYVSTKICVCTSTNVWKSAVLS